MITRKDFWCLDLGPSTLLIFHVQFLVLSRELLEIFCYRANRRGLFQEHRCVAMSQTA